MKSDPGSVGERILVFVYGSLKRGLSNHHWMRSMEFVAEAKTLPQYRMVDIGGYPGLIAAGEKAIDGELWWGTEADLRRLDVLEGVRFGEYGRGEVALSPSLKQPHTQALAYFYLRSTQGLKEAGCRWEET